MHLDRESILVENPADRRFVEDSSIIADDSALLGRD